MYIVFFIVAHTKQTVIHYHINSPVDNFSEVVIVRLELARYLLTHLSTT